MKKSKAIDTWISIVLIASFTIASLIRLDYTFLVGYCVVGGWQLVSIVIHVAKGWFTTRRAGRYYYQITVAILLGATLLGLLVYPLLWSVMIVLLFAAPVMAVYYTWLCYRERFIGMKRPLDLLK
ncbi:MAG: hypothetical protein EOO03_10095 [Chitinophagaceae bacterium]|nr:MAG: hypothetical protein EOO03_10095 [Chitinophagaceae bacterium]